jgi:L-amino acid N-acyltransferase YncA
VAADALRSRGERIVEILRRRAARYAAGMIRPATSDDADAICAIYNHHVAHTVVTFEEQPVAAADMRARMTDVAAAQLPWLVLEEAGEVLGYSYAGRWKPRSAYRFTVESTIYLAEHAVGRGIGRALYGELLAELARLGVHAVLGGISLPNAASVALHEKLGFTQVAHFRELGWKFERWIDVGYWQLQL